MISVISRFISLCSHKGRYETKCSDTEFSSISKWQIAEIYMRECTITTLHKKIL